MKVLVDGHNAMAALRVRGVNHEAQRRALLRRVAAVSPHATVYFDARHAPADLLEVFAEHGLHVVYCRGAEADDAIVERVRNASAPGRYVVVTNDREVAGRCRQLGAQASGVVEFFGPGPIERVEGAAGAPSFARLRGHWTPGDFGLPEEVDLEHPGGRLEDDAQAGRREARRDRKDRHR